LQLSNGDVAISMDQAMLYQRDMTDDYLQSRANAMQSIESTIVELGGIFQQLAHMIKGNTNHQFLPLKMSFFLFRG